MELAAGCAGIWTGARRFFQADFERRAVSIYACATGAWYQRDSIAPGKRPCQHSRDTPLVFPTRCLPQGLATKLS